MGFLEKLFRTHTKAEMKQMEKEWAAFDKEQEEWEKEQLTGIYQYGIVVPYYGIFLMSPKAF